MEHEVEVEDPVLLVTHVKNILRSIAFIVQVCKNKQQKQFKWTLCTQILPFQKQKGSSFEYKGVLHCKSYGYDEPSDKIMKRFSTS